MVTDGGFRDAPRSRALDMPAFHMRPSAPTNLTLHQAIDINVPIGCGDAPVFPGDVVVGDMDGVIIIPAGIADEIADEAVEMTAFEDFVIERVRGGQKTLGLVPAHGREQSRGVCGVAEGTGTLTPELLLGGDDGRGD